MTNKLFADMPLIERVKFYASLIGLGALGSVVMIVIKAIVGLIMGLLGGWATFVILTVALTAALYFATLVLAKTDPLDPLEEMFL